jgi:transketolase C-terminal domain/subunit
VGGDGVKDAGSGGGGSEAESKAELAIEVAASEGGVVTVGEAKAVGGLGEAVAQSAEETGFSDARFTTQEY